MSPLERIGVRRLDLGGGGSGWIEYVLAGSLAAVILLALVLSVMTFMGGGGGGKPVELRFKCLEYDHEFSLTQDDLDIPEDPQERSQYMQQVAVRGYWETRCPEHGTRAVQMFQCVNPDCEKWYVPEWAHTPYDPNDPYGPEKNRICPHCGADQVLFEAQRAAEEMNR